MAKATANEFLNIAKKLVGTVGGDKVRNWYNKNVENIGSGKWAWCCATVVYCAVNAGVPKDIITHTASSSVMLNFFKSKGLFHERKDYTPKPSDIILFDYIDGDGMPASHIGIVEKTADGYVHTIEGNSGNKSDGECARWKYSLTNSRIVGYCTPKFAKSEKTAVLKENGAIYKYAYKDVIGESSKNLKNLKKGDKVTLVEDTDDGYGWSKVKYEDITGWMMNKHLNVKGLSSFKKYTLKSDTNAFLIEDKKLSDKVKLKKNTKYTSICEIEKGEYKGYSYIKVNGKHYYAKL